MSTRISAVAVVLSVLAGALFGGGCVSNPIPDDKVLRIDQLGQSTHGLWVVVALRADTPVEGELLAADRREIIVAEHGVVHIPLSQVEKATVCVYPWSKAGAIWASLGLASTASHGGYLIISAPIWLATALIAGTTEHNAPLIVYPDDPIEELAKYARFPIGLPPGF